VLSRPYMQVHGPAARPSSPIATGISTIAQRTWSRTWVSRPQPPLSMPGPTDPASCAPCTGSVTRSVPKRPRRRGARAIAGRRPDRLGRGQSPAHGGREPDRPRRKGDRSDRCRRRLVSRRHARIVADGGRFTLEDLGSKNGTYLREQRLKAAAALEDGDAFRLGHA
jgi:pSer/pThr/pTyr-binding forkhead associated (FHA) protein